MCLMIYIYIHNYIYDYMIICICDMIYDICIYVFVPFYTRCFNYYSKTNKCIMYND